MRVATQVAGSATVAYNHGSLEILMPSLTSGPALFIQPHYDDVPLSCGGTVALLASGGHEPHMVTVFASELLPQMVGEFAAWKHERWKLTDPDQVLEARRAEDAAAARALGCAVRWLGLPDAIYRDRYTSDQELFGPLPAEERELASHLAEEIRHLPEWREGNRVFVPLGSARMWTTSSCSRPAAAWPPKGWRSMPTRTAPMPSTRRKGGAPAWQLSTARWASRCWCRSPRRWSSGWRRLPAMPVRCR